METLKDWSAKAPIAPIALPTIQKKRSFKDWVQRWWAWKTKPVTGTSVYEIPVGEPITVTSIYEIPVGKPCFVPQHMKGLAEAMADGQQLVRGFHQVGWEQRMTYCRPTPDQIYALRPNSIRTGLAGGVSRASPTYDTAIKKLAAKKLKLRQRVLPKDD